MLPLTCSPCMCLRYAACRGQLQCLQLNGSIAPCTQAVRRGRSWLSSGAYMQVTE